MGRNAGPSSNAPPSPPPSPSAHNNDEKCPDPIYPYEPCRAGPGWVGPAFFGRAPPRNILNPGYFPEECGGHVERVLVLGCGDPRDCLYSTHAYVQGAGAKGGSPPPYLVGGEGIESCARAPFLAGTRVRLHGLTGAKELNGRVGPVLRYDRAKDRFAVRVDGQAGMERAVRGANLEVVGGEGEGKPPRDRVLLDDVGGLEWTAVDRDITAVARNILLLECACDPSVRPDTLLAVWFSTKLTPRQHGAVVSVLRRLVAWSRADGDAARDALLFLPVRLERGRREAGTVWTQWLEAPVGDPQVVANLDAARRRLLAGGNAKGYFDVGKKAAPEDSGDRAVSPAQLREAYRMQEVDAFSSARTRLGQKRCLDGGQWVSDVYAQWQAEVEEAYLSGVFNTEPTPEVTVANPTLLQDGKRFSLRHVGFDAFGAYPPTFRESGPRPGSLLSLCAAEFADWVWALRDDVGTQWGRVRWRFVWDSVQNLRMPESREVPKYDCVAASAAVSEALFPLLFIVKSWLCQGGQFLAKPGDTPGFPLENVPVSCWRELTRLSLVGSGLNLSWTAPAPGCPRQTLAWVAEGQGLLLMTKGAAGGDPVPFVGFSEHLPACLARVKERPEAAAEAVVALVPFLTGTEAKAMGAEAALLWRVFVDEEYRDDGRIRVCRVAVPRSVVEAERGGAVDVCLGDAVHRAVWRGASGKAGEDARNVEFFFFARREDVDAAGGKATVRCDGRPLQKKKQAVVCWDVAEKGLSRLREERGFSPLACATGEGRRAARAVAKRGGHTPQVTAVLSRVGAMALTLTFTFPGAQLRATQGEWTIGTDVSNDEPMIEVGPPPKSGLKSFVIVPPGTGGVLFDKFVQKTQISLTGKNSVTLVVPQPCHHDFTDLRSNRTTLCYMQLQCRPGDAPWDAQLLEGLRAQAAAERGVPLDGFGAAQLELFERAHRNADKKGGYELQVRANDRQSTVRPRAMLVERETLVPCLDATITITAGKEGVRSNAVLFDKSQEGAVQPLILPERRLWGRSQVRPLTHKPLLDMLIPGDAATACADMGRRASRKSTLVAMWHYYNALKAHREGGCATGFRSVVNVCVNASVLLYRELQARMAWEWDDFPAAEWAEEAVSLLQDARKHWCAGRMANVGTDPDRWFDVAEGTAQLRLALALEVVGEGTTDRAQAAVRRASALLPGDAGVAAALDRLCSAVDAADADDDNDDDDAAAGGGDGAVVAASGREERWGVDEEEVQVDVGGDGFCAGGIRLIPDRVLRKHDVVAKAAVVLGWFAPAWGDLECIDLLRVWWNEQHARARARAVAYEPTALPRAVRKQVMAVSVAGCMEDVVRSFGTPSCDACDVDLWRFKVNSEGQATCPACKTVLREV
eukprot:Rhum_TRINITY_DN11812_c0_g2::Rhum_TRINITY_DN11812_c0_g2_i1::g.47242::m.47242